MINIRDITIDQPHYCLNCNSFSAKGTMIAIQDLNDTEYMQLQECGWRRSGERFYHTNQNSCCQQTISKRDVCQYQQPKSLKKTLRKLTSEYFDIDLIKQSAYSNLLQYIDQTRPSPENLQTKSAFHDFLVQLSQRLSCTNISPTGFKSHSTDTLCFHVNNLNQELHMNVRVDKRNCLHFKWLNDFTKLLQKSRRSSLQTVITQAHYDEEAHLFYNAHYFEVPQSSYIKNFCADQNKMIKYYIHQELVAVGFLETRQNSLHRLALHYNRDVNQINRIAQDVEIQLAKSLNLRYLYFVTIIKSQPQIVNNQPITDDFIIKCGNKNIQIKNLKPSYKEYMLRLLNQLNNFMTVELIKHIIFKYQ